ncbi:hypothetical protein ACVMIH_005199 [Bradyrhizobium sp. USDA 4503]
MSNSDDWFWRLRMGLPPRPEDREAIRRIAPELFNGEHWFREPPQQEFWHAEDFRSDIRSWLATDDPRPLVTVRAGTCAQPDCPLQLGRPHPGSAGSSSSEAAAMSGEIVLELMTVAGGWSAKSNAFLDAARKVHSGKGPAKDLLITDPFIYADKGEEGTVGGINNFLTYLDLLEIPTSGTLTIFQPPFAKGKKAESGWIWRRSVKQHGENRGYKIKFTYFRTKTGTRFHDRFYLVRHRSGEISGLFGPSMNGLNDRSFVLIGELEAATVQRVCSFIDEWA